MAPHIPLWVWRLMVALLLFGLYLLIRELIRHRCPQPPGAAVPQTLSPRAFAHLPATRPDDLQLNRRLRALGERFAQKKIDCT